MSLTDWSIRIGLVALGFMSFCFSVGTMSHVLMAVESGEVTRWLLATWLILAPLGAISISFSFMGAFITWGEYKDQRDFQSQQEVWDRIHLMRNNSAKTSKVNWQREGF